MNIGPFHLTNDVSLGVLLQIAIIIPAAFRFFAHLSSVNKQVNSLWKAVMGDGPQDSGSFFYRFAVMEQRVKEMWLSPSLESPKKKYQ